VTGNSIRHVGERFERSGDTISRYFRRILYILSGADFYNGNLHLPISTDSISSYIATNPGFYPFFADCVGAIDGTHIHLFTSEAAHNATRNRK
ncbi:hypothetical protein OBBRIDRAFT_709264, partial [Obba rivulosa]